MGEKARDLALGGRARQTLIHCLRQAVAIEPGYGHSKKRQVCVGGLAGELTLCWKETWGIFSSNKKKVVCYAF